MSKGTSRLCVLLVMRSQYASRASGVSLMAFALLEHLLSVTSHDYILLSPWSRHELPAALGASRLRVEQAPRPRFMALSVAWDALQMPAWCRAMQVDAILNIDPFGTPAGGRRRITVVHDLYFRDLRHCFGWRERWTSDLVLRWMLQASHAVVCVSDATRRSVTRCYSAVAERAVTIHSAAVPLIADPSPCASRCTGPYLLAVGNATPNKNFALLGRALQLLHPAYPRLRLIHVGRDPYGSLLDNLPEGLRASVIRRSDITAAELRSLYEGAIALCVPSLSEGFCLPVLEAQQALCPVICAHRAALPEIAGEGALLFDPESAQSLADQISRLMTEPGLADRLRQLGQDNLARFSWRTAAVRYAELLEAGLAG